MRRVLGSTCLLLLTAIASTVSAQDASERARQAFAEGRAHEDEGRPALAAQRYLEAYELMREAGSEDAPLVLWNAGEQLSHVPGREQEAIDTIRRFLHESTALADEASQVRDWRSRALARLDELEARVPVSQGAEGLSTPETDEPHRPPEEDGGESLSPIGPIVMGAGGALLVPGLIIAIVGLVQNQEHINDCPDRVECADMMPAAADVEATRNLGLAGDVLWIAGASVAVVGLVLTLTLTESSGDGGAEAELRGVPGGGIASLRVRVQ